MGVDPSFAEKHIEDTAKSAAKVYEKLQEESIENRRSYERFYDNLALLSAGTIALSVTYLGYLKSSNVTVLHKGLLISSWSALLACLVISAFYSFLHAHYVHFSRLEEFNEKKREHIEAEATSLNYLNIVNIQTDAEREAFRMELTNKAERYGQAATWGRRRKFLYLFLWTWGGSIARLAFVGGLGLLFAFAVVNT